jgi:hypothetical protein
VWALLAREILRQTHFQLPNLQKELFQVVPVAKELFQLPKSFSSCQKVFPVV